MIARSIYGRLWCMRTGESSPFNPTYVYGACTFEGAAFAHPQASLPYSIFLYSTLPLFSLEHSLSLLKSNKLRDFLTACFAMEEPCLFSLEYDYIYIHIYMCIYMFIYINVCVPCV